MTRSKDIISFVLALSLVGLAAFLRFYHAYSLPFNYDELSAVSRTHFNSFNELIDKGVMTIYTNPAGIQVLLYYWTKLFGYSEFIVKLPFMIFGCASVLYVFLIGKKWFSFTTGLVCAAYLASLQYFVMWSQLARPLIPGVFFSLAMVYHWSKIVFEPGKRYDLHWVLYVFFAACCAYTHHFCLLFVVITGVTGIFFANRNYMIRYITAGVMVFVLYIPHLHIFFYQLSMKGIGTWLGAPKNNFILTYLDYVFQFSPWIELCAGAMVVAGIVAAIWKRKAPNRFFYISIAWFIIPFLAGFFYSRYVNPLLQPSVLIFSLPFLLLGLFGLLPEVHMAIKIPVVILISALNVYVLFVQRKHYEIFYRAPIEQNALLTDSVQRAMGKTNSISLMELDVDGKRNERYYAHKYNLDTSFITVDSSMDKVSFTDLLEDHPRKFLSYSTMAECSYERLPVILSFYPALVKQYDFYGGTFYLLSSEADKYKPPYSFQSDNGFEQQTVEHWEQGPQAIVDSVHFSGSHSYRMDSLHEFGPTFSCKLGSMITGKNDLITVSVAVYPLAKMDDVMIVSTLEANGKQVDWRSSSVNDYVMVGTRKQWAKAFHVIKLSDIDVDPANTVLKIYIWNKGKRNFFIDDFNVKTVKGNPIIYGLSEKI